MRLPKLLIASSIVLLTLCMWHGETAVFGAAGSLLTLQNDTLEVRFDPANASFTVKDKRTGRLWAQTVPTDAKVAIEGAKLQNGCIVAQMKAGIPFTARISLSNDHPAEVAVELKADPKARFPNLDEPAGKWESGPSGSFAYPFPFLCDAKKGQHLETTLPGYMTPATEKVGDQEVRLSSESADRQFNWMGTVEGEAGMALYMTTPDDAAFKTVHVKPAAGPEIVAWQPSWRSSLGAWGYDRKCVYFFSDQGNYVKLVSWVRDQYRQAGLLVTLAEKARKTPAVAELAGAPIIWLWGDGRTNPATIRDMKARGIEKARLCFDPNHGPYPSAEVVKAINDCGYQLGIYNLFKNQLDVDNPASADVMPLDSRVHWRTPDWKNCMLMRADGTTWRWKDMMSLSGKAVGFYIISPAHYLDTIAQDFAEEMKLYPDISNRLLDTWAANPLREEYRPGHETTRAYDREQRSAVVEWLADHNSIVGTENNSSWYLKVGHYSEGSMSLEQFRTLVGGKPRVPPADGETVEIEDLAGPARDKTAATATSKPAKAARAGRASKMAKAGGTGEAASAPASAPTGEDLRGFGSSLMKHQEPAPRMIELDYEPLVRLPLLELLAHDCLVSTFHWRDCSNRNGSDAWDHKDLWNILYGTLPLWNLDAAEWTANKARFVQCYQNVCRWHEKVFGAQMVDHRFLTEDRFVQQTRFSNGWAVTVNFQKDRAYTDDGVAIAPMSFRTFRWSEKP